MNVSKVDFTRVVNPLVKESKPASDTTESFKQILNLSSETPPSRHDNVTLSPAAVSLADKEREIERVRAQGRELSECEVSRAELAICQVPSWMIGFANSIVEVVGSQTIETRLTHNVSDGQMQEFRERLQAVQQTVSEGHGLWGVDDLEHYVIMNTTPGIEATLHREMNEAIRSDARLVALIAEIGFYMTDIESPDV